MNKITLPYHLAIPTCICIAGLLIIFIYRKRLLTQGLKKRIWISVIIFFVVYMYVVGSAAIYDIYYQWDLNRYDVNKNGIFDSEEITREQELAMHKLINDVGRNFSFITGLIIGLAASAIVFVFSSFYQSEKH